MVFMPRLGDYDVNVLVALANNSGDEMYREQIKRLILEKILMVDDSMFFLLNKFMKSNKILKEVYAKVILIRMQNENYNIDDALINEILSFISLDDLTEYGVNACSSKFREKCIEEFWARAVSIENVSE